MRSRSSKSLGAVVLMAAVLTVTGCSAGGSNGDTPPDKSPEKSAASTDKAQKTKLVRQKGKADIKNVFAKIEGGKISLSAKAPGHELMEQVYDADTKTWSDPTSVFKDDTRFCHSIRLKAKDGVIAATVTCSISAQDVDGTQLSYVLASTDGKTWKRADLSGAQRKPEFSPISNYVSWSGPNAFLLWSAVRGTFTPVKYAQDEDEPTIGVIRSNGQLVLLKAVPGRKDTCSIAFYSSTIEDRTPRLVNSTLPQQDHPKCVATSAKMQGSEIIANFEQTETIKEDDKKKTETTTFAYAFGQSNGRWVIKR